ncbi:MAG: hypothetical protein ACREU7_07760 [Burkholderiales bacterium]
MLNWMKGGGSDHPLAQEKAARELLADLPVDVYKILDEFGGWLDQLQDAGDLRLLRAFEIIDLLDHAARGHLRKLQQEYVSSGGRLQRFQESRIWSTSASFWRRLGKAHVLLIKRFRAEGSSWGSIKDRLPLIAARGIRAVSMLLKWQLMRYGPVDRETWDMLGYLFAFAEDNGIAAKIVTVYPGSESTIQHEYLRPAMLFVSSTDSLLPAKLDIGERLIAYFADQYLIQRQPGKGCHFFVDLNSGAGPARFVARVEMKPGVRFLGPGNTAKALKALAATIDSGGAVPSNMDLGGVHTPEVVIETIEHLAKYWSPQPPARSEERRRAVSQVMVAHGFDNIVARLREGYDEDPESIRMEETWTVENESAGGYGAVMTSAAGDWVKVGALIGIKLSDGGAWGVGVVRRISARDSKQRYVGIQLLARGATIVRLRAADSGMQPQVAVLLPSSAADARGSGEMSLLLREGGFSPKTSLEMVAYERSYLLAPRKLVEEGADFDMARFLVMQAST